jgi:teichuronic acid biosynthesis glycosyltransferase TuaH
MAHVMLRADGNDGNDANDPDGSDVPADLDGAEVVVVFAATPWSGIWMSERHLALQLAKRIPVLWVDPPISWLTPLRSAAARASIRGPRLGAEAPGLVRLTPVTIPGHSRPVLRSIARAQLRRAVRGVIRRRGLRVRASIVASLDDLLGTVPAGRTLFYGTDDFVAGAELMGVSRDWLKAREERQLRQADVVVAVSPVLKQTWSQLRPDAVVVPNGCDAAHFAGTDEAPLPDDVALPGPVAGFVGHLSDRIELACLEAVARRGISLLLVGPRQPTFELARMDALLSQPNVQWVGPKAFGELPSYLRLMDVGLTPYADSAFNRASYPLKTLEYLAAGRPVVATDLPAMRLLETDGVTLATAPEDFADAVAKRLADPGSELDAADRRAFGVANSWARRADVIAGLLGLPDNPLERTP